MLDFLKLTTQIADWDKWRSNTPHLKFETRIDAETGEIIRKAHPDLLREQFTTKQSGCDGDYEYTIITSEKNWKVGTYETTQNNFLWIAGSAHKNYYNGENYLPFGWSALQSEISNISSLFCVDEHNTRITRMEIGVNIELPFSAYNFLRESLVTYKTLPFNRYRPDRRGIVLGYECGLKDYKVKAYDKGLQYRLPYNLLRFELSYKNMTQLRQRGISMLSDLRNKEIVSGLSSKLLKSWDDILLGDLNINTGTLDLNKNDSCLLRDGSNPRYWEHLKELNRNRFNYQRSRYKKLIATYGEGKHRVIRNLLESEWNRLLSI